MTLISSVDFLKKDWSKKDPEFVRNIKAKDSASEMGSLIGVPEKKVESSIQPVIKNTAEKAITGAINPDAIPSFPEKKAESQNKISLQDILGDKESGIIGKMSVSGAEKPQLNFDNNLTIGENMNNYLSQKNQYTEDLKAKERRNAVISALSSGFGLMGDVAAMGLGGVVNPNRATGLNESLDKMDQYDSNYMKDLDSMYQTILNEEIYEKRQDDTRAYNDQVRKDDRIFRSNEAQKQRDYYTEKDNKANEAKRKSTEDDAYMHVGINNKNIRLNEGQYRELYMNALKDDDYLSKGNIKTIQAQYINQPIEGKKEIVQDYANYLSEKESQQQQQQQKRQLIEPGTGPLRPSWMQETNTEDKPDNNTSFQEKELQGGEADAAIGYIHQLNSRGKINSESDIDNAVRDLFGEEREKAESFLNSEQAMNLKGEFTRIKPEELQDFGSSISKVQDSFKSPEDAKSFIRTYFKDSPIKGENLIKVYEEKGMFDPKEYGNNQEQIKDTSNNSKQYRSMSLKDAENYGKNVADTSKKRIAENQKNSKELLNEIKIKSDTFIKQGFPKSVVSVVANAEKNQSVLNAFLNPTSTPEVAIALHLKNNKGDFEKLLELMPDSIKKGIESEKSITTKANKLAKVFYDMFSSYKANK